VQVLQLLHSMTPSKALYFRVTPPRNLEGQTSSSRLAAAIAVAVAAAVRAVLLPLLQLVTPAQAQWRQMQSNRCHYVEAIADTPVPSDMLTLVPQTGAKSLAVEVERWQTEMVPLFL